MSNEFKSVRAIAFDWDGTLVDSFPEIGHAFQCAAQHLGLPSMDSQVIRRHVGAGHESLFRGIIKEQGLTMDIPDQQLFWDAFYKFYRSDSVALFSGVISLLKALNQSGYDLYIATNKPSRSFYVEYNAMNELHSLFKGVYCADQYKGKPDPAMLQAIMVDAEIDAEAILMVGDTSFDILAAQAINAPVIAVSCGNMTIAELLAFNPNRVLTQTHDILGCLTEELAEL